MKTEINLSSLAGDTLTILEGKALELKHPVQIKLEGNIETVAAFLEKRWNGDENFLGSELQQVDASKAVVIVDSEAMVITLFLDPQNPFGTEVKAKLEFTPEIQQFKINEVASFTREQLIKILRFNRRYFPDVLKYDELLKAYQSLQISTAADLKQNSDTRGNKGTMFQKTVNSENIPTEFILNIPIFKGQPWETFRVEICLDATDASVRFWFESVELAELVEVRKAEIFADQLESAKDFVIIHK